jgi:hypothetical protein
MRLSSVCGLLGDRAKQEPISSFYTKNNSYDHNHEQRLRVDRLVGLVRLLRDLWEGSVQPAQGLPGSAQVSLDMNIESRPFRLSPTPLLPPYRRNSNF